VNGIVGAKGEKFLVTMASITAAGPSSDSTFQGKTLASLENGLKTPSVIHVEAVQKNNSTLQR